MHHPPERIVAVPAAAPNRLRAFAEYHPPHLLGHSEKPRNHPRKAERGFLKSSYAPEFERLPITARRKLIAARLRRTLRAVRQPISAAVETDNAFESKRHAHLVM